MIWGLILGFGVGLAVGAWISERAYDSGYRDGLDVALTRIESYVERAETARAEA